MKTRYLLSDVARLPITRFAVWLLVSVLFPLPTLAATLYSFRVEVIALPPGAHLPLTDRVLTHLEQIESHEPDPWVRDDLRISWITTLYASQGNPQPDVDATYIVLGIHPNKVWPAILARRARLLGEKEDDCHS